MKRLLILLFLPASLFLSGQQTFQLTVKPIAIDESPPLHAPAYAQYDGKWLFIGGETTSNGLERTPNLELVVVDPALGRVWTTSLIDLCFYVDDAEQMAAVHMQHHQVGNTLYLLGGYGYSSKAERYLTFPYLTTVAVDAVVEAVVAGRETEIGNAFRQYYDEDFALMNGRLTSIDNKFYLIGGERRFEPEPSRCDQVIEFLAKPHGDGEISIIKTGMYAFEPEGEGLPLSVPQIFPDYSQGVTLFQNARVADGRRLSWTNFYGEGYSSYLLTDQPAPLYHSAALPVYDELYNIMHTVFIGGCLDYLCTDRDFFGHPEMVDAFTRFSRGTAGQVAVASHPMPPVLLRGKDALWLPNTEAPHFENGVVKLNELPAQPTLIGYLYGGASTYPGGQKIDEGYRTAPCSQWYAVYLDREDGLFGFLAPASSVK